MNHKLCIYAICKNESKFVEQWINNMSEADYIVVLDTGSTDGTYEMLQGDERITRVEQKIITPWRFDVARNESMKLIPEDADILVCTDFDELFNPGWTNEIKAMWDSVTGVNRVFYPYAWSHNANGEPTDIFQYDKVHDRNFSWRFPVHEVLWPINDSIETVAAVTKDTNKLFLQHYPDNSKPRSYYFDLLKLSVQENNEDCHVRMLLAREYLIRSELKPCADMDSALEEYLAVLHMPDVDTIEKRDVLLESLGRVAQIYLIKEHYDETIWYCQEWIKEDYTYREPYLMLAEVYNKMKMPVLAKAMIETALKYTNRKFSWVERAGSWEGLPYGLLSDANYQLDEIDEAIENCNKALVHDTNNISLLNNMRAFLELKIKKLETKNE